MGKASSAKKIKRVQQAGVSRAPGQRRNLGYPALIAVIVIVGCVGVFFARNQRSASASEAPVANQDHWHAAFGIDICGEFQDNLADAGPDTKGIHTHQDGLIHIHPFGAGGAGENAVFDVYAVQTGITFGDGEFTLPNGETYKNGDECPAEEGEKAGKGQVAMYVWPPQATESTEPEVITENLGDIRFTDDGQIFVLSFAPKGDTPKLPPSVPALAAPADLEPGAASQEGSTDFTTTTPGSTAPAGATGDASTTVPAGETGDTTPPATETTQAGNG